MVNDGTYTGGAFSHENCSICDLLGCRVTGCKASCKYNDDNIASYMATWVQRNPQPQLTVQKPVFLQEPPTGNNVQCCSQLFENINATSVNFSNISQNCSQSITNQINALLATTAPPTTTPTVTTPVPTTPAIMTPTPAPVTPMSMLIGYATKYQSYIPLAIIAILLLLMNLYI
jgi:hypothetical protein